MLKLWLSAVFAVFGTIVFVLTIACPVRDPVLCSILHPVNYFMVIFSMFVSICLWRSVRV